MDYLSPVCQDLAEFLLKEKDSITKLVNFIKETNPQKLKFHFSGKIIPEFIPEVVWHQALIEENLDSYTHSQVSNYLCQVNQVQDSFFRTQPWEKISENFYKSDYYRFDLTSALFPNDKFFEIPVKFIQVYYKQSMLVPKELWMLLHLSFPSISTTFGFIKNENQVFVVVEKYPSTLQDLIMQELPREEKISLFKQLVSVIGILHSKNVMGFEMQPSKIDVDSEGMVRIWDFSLAEMLAEQDEGKKIEDLLRLSKCLKSIAGTDQTDPLCELADRIGKDFLDFGEIFNQLNNII